MIRVETAGTASWVILKEDDSDIMEWRNPPCGSFGMLEKWKLECRRRRCARKDGEDVQGLQVR